MKRSYQLILISIVAFAWAAALFESKIKEYLIISYNMDGAAALISGIAFMGFLVSLNKQQQTMELQREDLALTRREMEDTRAVMEAQNAAFELQKFENTFFKMLELLQEIVKEIKIVRKNGAAPPIVYSGRSAFSHFFSVINYKYKKNIFDPIVDDWEERERNRSLEGTNDIFSEEYRSVRDNLGHYFRMLYRIFVIIDSQRFSKDASVNYREQYKYTAILRSQLSDSELLVLFFYCLADTGRRGFKPLIEKYSFFLNLLLGELEAPSLQIHYAPSAFSKPRKIKLFLDILKLEDYHAQLVNQMDDIF